MESKLQIISGRYRGRRLHLPPDARPTQNMARIALFNMLESGIVDPTQNMVVWDAFAGSGAFGLECLSRYVGARVIFTDVAGSSIRTVRANLSTLGVCGWATVKQCDAIGAINQYGEVVDMVFVDPPYANADLGRAFVKHFACRAHKGAIVVWEQEICNLFEPDTRHWEILRDKTYGRARFLILQRK